MALDAEALGTEIIDAVDAAIEPIDKDPNSNPEMGDEIKEAMWKAVAEAIVAHIEANAEVTDAVGGGSPTGDGVK